MKPTLRSVIAWSRFRGDIPLARDEASRFLPWIIALMVYLSALTLAGSFTLHRTVSSGHAAQVDSFSVHLPAGIKSQEAAGRAVTILRGTRGVAYAEIISADRIRDMVEPWLGKSAAIDTLPLPVIIEGRLTPGSALDYEALKTRLQALVPGVDVDSHRQWIAQFSSFVHFVQWMLLAIAVIIMAASASAVIFACKTSLKIHRSAVALLHRLGAYDGYIAGQFQKQSALLALRGAFIGSGLAAGTLLVLHILSHHLDSPLLPSFSLNASHWVILLALPLLMGVIALASARFSVLAALRRMP